MNEPDLLDEITEDQLDGVAGGDGSQLDPDG